MIGAMYRWQHRQLSRITKTFLIRKINKIRDLAEKFCKVFFTEQVIIYIRAIRI